MPPKLILTNFKQQRTVPSPYAPILVGPRWAFPLAGYAYSGQEKMMKSPALPHGEISTILGPCGCPEFQDIGILSALQQNWLDGTRQKVFQSWRQWCRATAKSVGPTRGHSAGAPGGRFCAKKSGKMSWKIRTSTINLVFPLVESNRPAKH